MVGKSTCAGTWARNASISGIIFTPVSLVASHCSIMTTIEDALKQATSTLAQVSPGHRGLINQARTPSPNPTLDAQVLLSHALNVERATLYAYPERTLTAEQERQFHLLVQRRKRGEPVAYL